MLTFYGIRFRKTGSAEPEPQGFSSYFLAWAAISAAKTNECKNNLAIVNYLCIEPGQQAREASRTGFSASAAHTSPAQPPRGQLARASPR
jgi:hypothetical protein